ncbi:hypothetical protein [Flavobacterium psychrophilum]|uniref:Uncharacterized protein n=6 Tax=root TaxID=1 RepID=A0A1B0WM98_9CAUD|nr:hypothetical protein [Flavobacterium psychrophilum]YP_008320450.1 hypothetical protein N375_gp36 [Flavobacterium phage 6H]YP_009321851.1 N-acetylmuramoyl-L-alanine amidase [Flavobacterium phage 1H]YP_009322908.1 hypothetical protein BOX10_gp36 [Flavobacterium phage 2A]YP_009592343.1 hypothetical protein FDG69_gp35 [Flavobacterium phage 23T]QCW20048.1 hypothetical protein [Flavobacterium phage FPSV-D15]QCW20203.1 hypothetical protein [Flavobacterium phage FPSV-F7]QCW20762.1 hypothetical pr
MKNLKKITVILLLAAFLFLLVIPFTGCSSMKKHKEKESVKVDLNKESDSSAFVKTKIEELKKEQAKETEESCEEATEIQVKDGDSLEVTNYDSSGKKTGSKKYKGSGSIKNTLSKKKNEKLLNINTKTKIDSKSKTEISKCTNSKIEASRVSVNKEKKGFSFWSYLWLLIIVVLLYLNKRFRLI